MNASVNAYFDTLTGKRVAVLGIGVSNRPLIRMLLARGIETLACDKTPRDALDPEVLELEQLGAKLHVGPDYLDGITADVVFRTPGMHPDIPALRQTLDAMLEQGAERFVLGCTELPIVFSRCSLPYPVADPTQILAEAAVAFAGYPVKEKRG